MKVGRILGGLALLSVLCLTWRTWAEMRPCPASLIPDVASLRKAQVVDRRGVPLSVTFQNPWNLHDIVPLHDIPRFLQQAFVQAEDKRFYAHRGVDWWARWHALGQNVRAWRTVRGASTITEQVVRILHPRPRTLWSRWLEGFEAMRLEVRFPKTAILEFYLNQVPYARQRRGVLQAARTYFDRDLDTLSQHEMLALAVLVRAPGRLDPLRDATRLQKPLAQLATRMHTAHLLTTAAYHHILTASLALQAPRLPVQASHFLRHLRIAGRPTAGLQEGRLPTTLDAGLQQRAQELLTGRLTELQTRGVTDGALLVVDHQTSEILAWTSAGGSQIDAVLTPRQPGSTLKPFLYALALEHGWTAATLVEDTPLAQQIGMGLHAYRNYSGQHYGPLRVREALGNSLNVPAVRTVNFVGVPAFLERLHHLGFQSLAHPSDYYGNGLALGNGEVTLFELVQAYATLARHGVFTPLRAVHSSRPPGPSQQVYRADVSTIIAHILADPQARSLEFGRGNLLRFPIETAVKTGTSSDYRDAWALGFSHRYTAGVWLGNLHQRPMRDVTGALGPALVLRALFAEINREAVRHPLSLSPQLTPVTICRLTGQRATPRCPSFDEWFVAGTTPEHLCPLHAPTSQPEPAAVKPVAPLRLLQPTPGLQLAMDPRIPDTLEAFPFVLPKDVRPVKVEWLVDGHLAGTTGQHAHRFLWPLTPGTHITRARVWQEGDTEPTLTPPVEFVVR